MHVSYSYGMIMKPQLATKMWRDTVGLGSGTTYVGTTRCRLRFALLGCVQELLQVVIHRVRFLDHLNQNITPTRPRLTHPKGRISKLTNNLSLDEIMKPRRSSQRQIHCRPDLPSTSPSRPSVDVSVQIRRRRLRPDPPSTSPSRSVVSVQIHEAYKIETQNLKMLNPQQKSQLFPTLMKEGVCPFSTDKMYATTQVKAPPQLQKTGAVRVLPVSHGFVYEPYALHEKISWCRKSTVSVQTRRRRLRPDPPSTSPSRSAVDVSVQICCLRPDPRSIRDRNSKPQNVESSVRITTYCRVCPFSSDKRYATTQVKTPPQLQKTGAARVLPVLVHDIWVFEKSLFHTGA
ncbi:hypothetical protein F2Q69_00042504 [Brassica cretica]|uniref:Uncharacterized protein n=1 Tax=Brassica cretica TaxID=69181 RepID=A0A8S9NN04_BRACR|nr:hypothetical protein F2Q69_00042504 [Brassica cretica]